MSLPLTGERTVPDLPHENYWLRRHEIGYRTAAALCRDARVLDAGCGEGYGSAAIRAAGARQVVALDYDAATADHASRAYGLHSVRGNLVALPFADAAFDVVVSLQTIEHLWDQTAFLAECVRVLRPGGQLVLTTPNRHTFPIGNLFHHRELNAAELTELVAGASLRIDSLLGVHHGPRIDSYPGDLVADQLTAAPDTWPAGLAGFVAGITMDDFVLSATDLDGCLDLYLVAVRD